jgi:hypothetical protein
MNKIPTLHILIIKTLSIEIKKGILKASKEKHQITYKGKPNRIQLFKQKP